MKQILILLFVFLLPAALHAQQKKTTTVPTVKKCQVPSDTSADNTMSVAQITEWADSKPLQVKCGNGKMYSLTQFSITMIKHNPMQTLDYGTGINGFPILARKAMDQMQSSDTILLRDITAKDDAGNEVKLATIVFKVMITENNQTPIDSLTNPSK
jgi:hypothetical protein